MPQEEPEHETSGSDMTKREKPQESLVGDQPNLHPGQADDPDAQAADEPDDKEQRKAMLDMTEHEGG